MAKFTARNVRRRSAGEGPVYPYLGGHRGAITYTDPDGTRHKRTTVKCRTADEARGKLDDLRRELRLGTLTAGPSLTVGDYLGGWIERDRLRVRPATWRRSG